MKKITCLSILIIGFLGFSQNQDYLFDFEPNDPDGDVCNWATFENIEAAQIIDNPDLDGVNATMSKVLRVVAPSGSGNCFAGVNNAFAAAAFGEWDITQSTTNTITFDVNKDYIGTIGVQMIGSDGSAAVNITDTQNINNNIVNEWITLTYTIPTPPPTLGTNITAIVFFIDWRCSGANSDPRPADAVLHIDNIEFNADKISDPGASDFITSYDDDFESSTLFIVDGATSGGIVNNNDTGGINPSANCYQVDGINNGDFTNAQLTLPTPQTLDFCSFEQGFSIKVRGPRAVEVRLKTEVSGAGQEKNANYTDVGNWQELTYDFTEFINRDWNRVVLFFDITGTPSASSADDVFQFDDLQFAQFSTLSSLEVESIQFSIFPNPTKDSWNIQGANTTINTIEVYDILGKRVQTLTPNTTEATIDAKNLKTGIYLAKLYSDNGTKTIKLIKE